MYFTGKGENRQALRAVRGYLSQGAGAGAAAGAEKPKGVIFGVILSDRFYRKLNTGLIRK